jgi:hypothetical protein
MRTYATRARVRLLPARVVVYLLLAGSLFADQGWLGVWDRLCAGLGTRGAAAQHLFLSGH